MKPALFLDRDGTLNYDCPYCKNESETRMYEDVFEPLAELSKDHYVIIITNQSGIGRGYFTLEELGRVNGKVKREIESHGGRIDAIYYCPHLPEDNCSCRKPNTGLIEQAINDFDIDLKNSFVVGDDDKDVQLAKNSHIASIKIRKRGEITSDFFAEDFYGVLRIIRKVEGD